MRLLRIAFPFALFFFSCLSARSAENLASILNDYTVSHWNEDNGLTSGFVFAITQDTNGYIWLGTATGLVRFDGVRFVSSQSLGLQIPAAHITALHFARDGSFWIGFQLPSGPQNSYIIRIRNGLATNYGRADGINFGIFSLVETRDGSIWAGTSQRTGLLRFRSGHWERLTLFPESESATGSLLEDSRGNLWIGTQSGISYSRAGIGSFEPVDKFGPSQEMAEDRAGNIWTTSLDGFRQIGKPDDRVAALPKGDGLRLLVDQSNALWIATLDHGLWRYDLSQPNNGGRVQIITPVNGLATNIVRALFEDRERNIWIGTANGLYKLSPRTAISIASTAYVNTLNITPDGAVWLGTNHGLARIDSASGREARSLQEFSGLRITATNIDRNGTLLVAAEDRVYRLSGGRITQVDLPKRFFRQIMSLATDVHDNLWLADFYLGLFKWDGKQLVACPMPHTQLVQPTSVLADATGRVLVGYSGSELAVIEPDGTLRQYSSGISGGHGMTSIFEDRDNTVWFGSINGLSRLRNDQFETLDSRSGIPAIDLFGSLQDNEGYLWCASAAGIIRLDSREVDAAISDRRHKIAYHVLTPVLGTAGTPWAWRGYPSIAKGRDGRLWFVTSGGVTVVDPSKVHDESVPQPRIESVAVNDRLLDPSPQMRLPPHVSRIQIDYTLLTFISPGATHFRYKLEGFDLDWHDAGTERQALYTNLPPRSYRFRVMASGEGSPSNSSEAVWGFAVAPAYYQTVWFYTICTCAVALALWLAWRMRVRQLQSRLALIFAERSRIGSELHDILLQGLFGLRLQLDDLSAKVEPSTPKSSLIVGRLTSIRRQIDEFVRETRDAVWQLRLRNTDGDDLGASLQKIAERATSGTGILAEVNISGVPFLCDSKMREQLLSIAREAINNACRHGRPRQIRIALQYRKKEVDVRISDDGRGFDLQQQDSNLGHFGLSIMQERAKSLGAQFKIASAIGKGTQIELLVPLS